MPIVLRKSPELLKKRTQKQLIKRQKKKLYSFIIQSWFRVALGFFVIFVCSVNWMVKWPNVVRQFYHKFQLSMVIV